MMQLVLRADDGREYPVEFGNMTVDIEHMDFTRVKDMLALTAAVSDAHIAAIRSQSIRDRQPLRVIHGGLELRA